MKRDVFRDLVACQSGQSIVDYLQVSLRTVRRWKAGAAEAPHSAVLAIRLHLHCDLGALHPDWQGWAIGKGLLSLHAGRVQASVRTVSIIGDVFYRAGSALVKERIKAPGRGTDSSTIARLGASKSKAGYRHLALVYSPLTRWASTTKLQG